jgi:uncharacterized protein
MKTGLYKTLCSFGLLICLFGLSAPSVSAAEDDPRRKITVSGEAQINVTPDMVIIRVNVQTTDKSMAEAKRQNDGHVAALSNVAKNFGILPEHIQSEYLGIGGYYGISSGQPVTVRRNVEMMLKEVARFDSFLDILLRLEGITLQHIEFRTGQLRKYKDQARSLAVKAAKEKAEAMAGDLGQELGKPITITEDINRWWSYYSYYYGCCGYYGSGYGGANSTANAVVNAPAPTGSETLGGDTSLAPGQINITAKVTITFELAN